MSPTTTNMLTSLSSSVTLMGSPSKFHFSRFSPQQIAYHLHLLEFNIFKKINIIIEFSEFGWNIKNSINQLSNKNIPSSNIISMIRRFNIVSYWVATEVNKNIICLLIIF